MTEIVTQFMNLKKRRRTTVA